MENQDEVKLEALYDVFKIAKDKCVLDFCDDLHLNQPDENDAELNICADQKIIYCRDGKFLVSDLHDDHPTLEFATESEVYDFYAGMEGVGAVIGTKEKPLTPNDIAYNAGRYLDARGVISCTEEQFKASISKTQIKFKPEQAEPSLN